MPGGAIRSSLGSLAPVHTKVRKKSHVRLAQSAVPIVLKVGDLSARSSRAFSSRKTARGAYGAIREASQPGSHSLFVGAKRGAQEVAMPRLSIASDDATQSPVALHARALSPVRG